MHKQYKTKQQIKKANELVVCHKIEITWEVIDVPAVEEKVAIGRVAHRRHITGQRH